VISQMGKEILELSYKALSKLANLQQLQERIGIAMELSTAILDPSGRPITRQNNLCAFCSMISSTGAGQARCKSWQVKLAKAVAVSGCRKMQLCHAGLVCLAVPVKVKSKTVAVVMGGNVTLAPLAERKVIKLAKELGLDKEELLEAARAVPVWSEKRLREAVELFHSLVESLVHLSYSREELEQQTYKLSTLLEFSQTVSSTLNVPEVARRALEAVLSLTGAASGSVVMLSKETHAVADTEIAGSVEPSSDLRVIPRGEVVAKVTWEDRAVHFESHPERKTAEERLPGVSVPLRVGGKVTGVLTVAGKPQGTTFTEQEARFLTVLGTGLGLALENARLFRDLERKAVMLERLNEVGQTVSSSLEVGVVLDSALRSAKEIPGAEQCVLRLPDEQIWDLVLTARLGPGNGGRTRLERVRAERSVVDDVLKTGQPVVVENVRTCDSCLHLPPYSEKMRAAVIVPVRVRNRVLGTLEVYSSSPRQWKKEEVNYLVTLAAQTGVAVENARLYESLREHYRNAVQALAAALEAKDVYTKGHSLRVARWARACAREMGLTEDEQEHVYLAGFLHDLGKIGVREQILSKAGPLSPEEKKEMESHTVVGAKILEPAKFPKEVAEAVLYHHEDYRGGGYPEGISGEEIPVLARIIRVADAYDAMTSDRPYRKAYPHEWVVRELQRCAGKQFDPDVVQAFLIVVGKGRQSEELFDTAPDQDSPRHAVLDHLESGKKLSK